MNIRIYDECGINRAEMRVLRQIEKSKLMNLLERERRLTNLLAEHHAEMILKGANKPIEAADALLARIAGHPEIKKTDHRINNILDAFDEFKALAGGIRNRTREAASEKLKMMIGIVRRAA